MKRRWTSRKFILAMIGQVVGIVVLMFPEHESEIVTASQHVSALLIMGLSAFGYIRGEAQTDAASIKANSEMEMTREHMRGQRMREEHERQMSEREDRTNMEAAPLVALMLMLPLLSACATNPVDQYYELQAAASTARDSMLSAHSAGLISDEELVAMDAYEKAVRDSLDMVRANLPRDEAGELDPDGEVTPHTEWLLETAERVLDRLLARYEELSDDTAGDSDDPSGGEVRRPGEPGVLRMDRPRNRAGAGRRQADARAAPADRVRDSAIAA